MAYQYPQRGFDIQMILQVFSLNSIARVLGAIIRIITILAGFILLFLIAILGGLFLVSWFIFPLIIVLIPFPSLFKIGIVVLGSSLWFLVLILHFTKSESSNQSHFTREILALLQKNSRLSDRDLVKTISKTSQGRAIIDMLGVGSDMFIGYFTDQQSLNPQSIIRDLQSCQQNTKETKIGVSTIFYYLLNNRDTLRSVLDDQGISSEEFSLLLEWNLIGIIAPKRIETLSPNYLIDSADSFGRNWVLGFTLALDNVTTDFSTGVLQKRHSIDLIHVDLLNEILKTYSTTSKNILLLGKEGVGRKSLVQNFTYTLRKHQRDNNLPYTRVLQLQTADLLFGSQNAESYLLSALQAAESSGNVVLVIDNISQIITTSQQNIQMVISRFLTSPNIKVIAIDNQETYHSQLKNSALIADRFQLFTVPDADQDEVMRLLINSVHNIQFESKTRVTWKALLSSVELGNRYIQRGGQPGKSLQILQNSVVEARNLNQQFVTEAHVRQAISKLSKININSLETGQKQVLLDLSTHLKHDVIGQNESMDVLANSLKRAQAGIGQGRGPVGTFLFIGTTGVGKTETAKSLAKNYFGGVENMIRVDMNEYSQPDALAAIIGGQNSQGEMIEGFLTKAVQDNPASLILLDEIEKAHKNVLNVFLQILDEGQFIDARGIKIDFRNTIIIATSNAGALFIQQRLSTMTVTDKVSLKRELLSELTQSGYYTPEFLNRFDDILVFYPLSQESAFYVAQKMVQGIINEFYNHKGVGLRIDPRVVQYLSVKGYSPEFGAREMKRTVTEILENYLADVLLTKDVRRGQVIDVDLQKLGITGEITE